MVVSRPGKVVVRRPGKVVVRRPGKVVVRRPGKVVVRRPGKVVVRRPGKVVVRRPGKVVVRRPGKVGRQVRRPVVVGVPRWARLLGGWSSEARREPVSCGSSRWGSALGSGRGPGDLARAPRAYFCRACFSSDCCSATITSSCRNVSRGDYASGWRYLVGHANAMFASTPTPPGSE